MEEREELTPEEQQPPKPRPAWQVWGARIALAIFVIYLIFYYVNIFRGGM